MMQVESRVLCMMLFLLLGPSLGAASQGKDYTNRYIMERLAFGKMWYVYIKANIFDIAIHTFRMKTEDANSTFMSLQGVVTQINRIKISRYPCQNVNISFNGGIFYDTIRKRGLSQMEFGLTKSTICGSISRTLRTIAPSIIRPEIYTRNLTWIWQLRVNHHFIINVTFLSLESRFHPPCITRRALIQEIRDIDIEKRTLGIFCPNNPPQSYYSSVNNVEIHVHTWTTYEYFFLKNFYFNQRIGTVAFTYEILDNDLFLDPWKLLEKRWPTSKDDYYHYSELKSIYPAKLPSFRVTESSINEPNPYLFQLFESNDKIIFLFYLQAYLGATIAIRKGSLNCNNTQASLVAYEGPMVDITRIESLLVRLQEWNCGHYMKAKNHEEELKGRIGDMTVLFLVDKARTAYFYSLRLKVAYRTIEMDVSYAVTEKLYLETGSSINFEQKNTYFYNIDLQSVKTGFVNVYFDHIFLRGYMDQSCTYGGLYFITHANIYNSYIFSIGAMCSQKTATRFQRLYGRHGLTFTDRLVINIKQYHLLFLAHVKLRFSLEQCLGLYNLHMYTDPWKGVPDEKGHVKLIRELRPLYGHGYNFYYRWYGRKPLGSSFDVEMPSFIGIKRRNGTACYKVIYVNFDFLDIVDTQVGINDVVIATGRAENVRPSRMSMAFWNMDEELKHFDQCLANAFRFFPDNQNNEPYVLNRTPEEDAWVTLAFDAKFAINKTCLIFGGAFHVRVEQAFGYSQCFSEVGGYLYDGEHPIVPKGVCGRIPVNFYHRGRFNNNVMSFQRPLQHVRCCHLNMLVISTTSIPCVELARADIITVNLQTIEEFHAIYEWSNQIKASEMFAWQAMCTQDNPYNIYHYGSKAYMASFVETCISMNFVVWETCDVNIHYRMTLLPLVYKAITTDRQTCYGISCYIDSTKPYAVSWNGAQATCKKLNGSLVSVNSDAEWRFLIHNSILQAKAYIELIYIGYRTVSNPFQYDHILNSMSLFPLLSLRHSERLSNF